MLDPGGARNIHVLSTLCATYWRLQTENVYPHPLHAPGLSSHSLGWWEEARDGDWLVFHPMNGLILNPTAF